MVYISQIYFQDVQGTYFLSISEFPGSGSCAGLNRRSRAKRDQREWLGHGAKKQQLHFLIAITFLFQILHFLPPNQPMPKIMQRWVFKVCIMRSWFEYPPISSDVGLLENPPFSSLIFTSKSPFIGNFPLPRLIAGGYILGITTFLTPSNWVCLKLGDLPWPRVSPWTIGS